MDHLRRATLLDALATSPTVAEAARRAGWQRTYVAKLLREDVEFRAEVERRRAASGAGSLPRRGEPVARARNPLALPASAPDSPLVQAIAGAAPEAMARLRKILAIESDQAGVLLAQCKAAQLVLDAAGRPAPVGAIRVRAEDGERAVEAEGSGPGLEALVSRIMGGGPAG